MPENRHRYGELVVTTPRGRYYWARPLQLITFVPKGKQTRAEEKPLSEDWNRERIEIVREALAMEGIKVTLR